MVVPHSNAVCFGPAKYAETDEFPLLYTNVYNTYHMQEDKRKGMCCVYRIRRSGQVFSSELVQIIQIGFADVKGLWLSEHLEDVRPYGNFVVDGEHNRLYAFTMLDELQKTRIFAFDLPRVGGSKDHWEAVTLSESDILTSFDCEYSYYVQGAAFCKGRIISSEGFTDDRPGIRIFDVNKQAQERMIPLIDYGMTCEPEFVECYHDVVYYCDKSGKLYQTNLGK